MDERKMDERNYFHFTAMTSHVATAVPVGLDSALEYAECWDTREYLIPEPTQ